VLIVVLPVALLPTPFRFAGSPRHSIASVDFLSRTGTTPVPARCDRNGCGGVDACSAFCDGGHPHVRHGDGKSTCVLQRSAGSRCGLDRPSARIFRTDDCIRAVPRFGGLPVVVADRTRALNHSSCRITTRGQISPGGGGGGGSSAVDAAAAAAAEPAAVRSRVWSSAAAPMEQQTAVFTAPLHRCSVRVANKKQTRTTSE
jgi:hypothetical protein